MRIVCQFSCGAASAVATKLALAQHGDKCAIVNAYLKNEHPVAFGTIDHTERAGELLAELAHALDQKHAEYEDLKACAANNARNLAREAHTWSKAAEHYAKPLEPLDPLDVEELWDVANADPYVDEVHQAFARLVERKHGIGGC